MVCDIFPIQLVSRETKDIMNLNRSVKKACHYFSYCFANNCLKNKYTPTIVILAAEWCEGRKVMRMTSCLFCKLLYKCSWCKQPCRKELLIKWMIGISTCNGRFKQMRIYSSIWIYFLENGFFRVIMEYELHCF